MVLQDRPGLELGAAPYTLPATFPDTYTDMLSAQRGLIGDPLIGAGGSDAGRQGGGRGGAFAAGVFAVGVDARRVGEGFDAALERWTSRRYAGSRRNYS